MSKRILFGFIAGVCSLIPGVSSGTIFYISNIWDQLIKEIKNVLTFNFKNNYSSSILFLLTIFISFFLGQILFVSIYYYLLIPYLPTLTIFFFATLIFFSIFIIYKQHHTKFDLKFWIIAIVAFLILLILVIIGYFIIDWKFTLTSHKVAFYFYLFFVGALVSFDMLLPGVSGSMILLLFGLYNIVLSSYINLFIDFSWTTFLICFIFILGILFGFLIGSIFFTSLLKKNQDLLIACIYGLIVASSISIILIAPSNNIPIWNNNFIIIQILLGYFLAIFVILTILIGY